jgi:hypothetical protein
VQWDDVERDVRLACGAPRGVPPVVALHARDSPVAYLMLPPVVLPGRVTRSNHRRDDVSDLEHLFRY